MSFPMVGVASVCVICLSMCVFVSCVCVVCVCVVCVNDCECVLLGGMLRAYIHFSALHVRVLGSINARRQVCHVIFW